ncbi:hypothetical protein N8772_03545 [Rickettsiales bacterium]|nr:hypothetical protein [Rickettsiales bacterium]
MPETGDEITKFIDSNPDHNLVKEFIKGVSGNDFKGAVKLQTFLQKCSDNITSPNGRVENISGDLERIMKEVPQDFNSEILNNCSVIISGINAKITSPSSAPRNPDSPHQVNIGSR